MTSLLRGFDESLRDMIRTIGPDTIFVAEVLRRQPRGGRRLPGTCMKRPNMTPDDAEAIERGAPSIEIVSSFSAAAGRQPQRARLLQEPEDEAAADLRHRGAVARG